MQFNTLVKSKFYILFLFSFIASIAHATHYRAGEIIFRQISGYNYEITVYTYTDQFSSADPGTSQIVLDFGDKTSAVVNRTGTFVYNSDPFYGVKRNEYKTTHSYGGAGIYQLCIIDRNRVDNIRNINGGKSENIAFSVTTVLSIYSSLNNQSPVLLSLPIDRGCVNRLYVHNPGAYDPDGDSLAYEIRPPKFDSQTEVPGFQIPEHSDSFSIDQRTGTLTWRNPIAVGIYNIVIRVKEYRVGSSKGNPVLMGYVDRDMQIKIDACPNLPPEIAKVSDACVVAGNLVERNVSATDPDPNNLITLTGFGGPFVQKNSPAITSPNSVKGNSPVGFLFRWRPACTSIRASEFQVNFKVEDDGAIIALTHYEAFKIKVIGPAPRNFTATQDSNGFRLNWSPDSCNFAFGYRIYRRVDSSFWNPGSCQVGVPNYTGFELIDTVQGVNNTTFFDNNNGKGLSPLVNYCYRITSFYLARNDEGQIVNLGESSEGIASTEICATITRTKPIITNVSVLNTNSSNGTILVKWLKPLFLDSIQFEPPYTIQVQRANMGSNNFINVGKAKTYSSFSKIENDSLIDSLLNTEQIQYNYKIMFFCTKDANPLRYIDQSIAASSVFLQPYNTNKAVVLNFKFDVPWNNTKYDIYKQNGLSYDYLTTTNNLSYKDTGLINGQVYCYYIVSSGNYDTRLLADTLFNFSQKVCAIPIDTIAPCAPALTYESPCNQFDLNNIILNWTFPSNCENDVAFYTVYYKKNVSDNWKIIGKLNANARTFTDTSWLLKYSISGCYSVLATDSTGNESSVKSNEICLENCPYYVLPNVFTPNNNGTNDLFVPFKYRFIEGVDIQIFNRWGNPVFATTDIDIKWDGKDQETGQDLVTGNYFYIIKIKENYLNGTLEKKVRGVITLIR